MKDCKTSVVTDICYCTLYPVEAPAWIFLGQSQHKIHDDLSDTWPAWLLLPATRIIPFMCHELSMPVEYRIWRHNRGEFHQGFAAECFAFDGQKPPLVIVQKNPFFAKLLEQSLNLGILKLDDLLLTLIYQRRKQDKRQVPGLQDELHVATGCLFWKTPSIPNNPLDLKRLKSDNLVSPNS